MSLMPRASNGASGPHVLLLLIALQVLTLLEWQARCTLATEQATIAGLVFGVRPCQYCIGRVIAKKCETHSTIHERADAQLRIVTVKSKKPSPI